MPIKIEPFWLPKHGLTPDEYEDAFWPPGVLVVSDFPVRVAVADGATETTFSGLWARLLVEAYNDAKSDPSLLETLAPLQARWLKEATAKPLPWYAEAKLEQGAFAALVGITLSATQGNTRGEWAAYAVGDSCVFQLRGNDLIARFPLSEFTAFDNRPLLVSSVQANNRKLEAAEQRASGDWQVGDVFYLMTDAFACWFLRTWDALSQDGTRQEFVDQLHAISDQESFEAFVMEQGNQGQSKDDSFLRNDDQTFVRCHIEAD